MPEETITFGPTTEEAYAIDNNDPAPEPRQQARHGSPSVLARVMEIQRDLKVEKGQWNDFGKYRYRSKEDILEAVKPLCHERGLAIVCEDSIMAGGNGWPYVRTTATVYDVVTGESFGATGYAREPETKKGMDGSQITGTAASYAGKRALGNLFAIDDTKDADGYPAAARAAAKEPPAQGAFVAHCERCGTRYQFESADQYRAFAAAATCCPAPSWVVD